MSMSAITTTVVANKFAAIPLVPLTASAIKDMSLQRMVNHAQVIRQSLPIFISLAVSRNQIHLEVIDKPRTFLIITVYYSRLLLPF